MKKIGFTILKMLKLLSFYSLNKSGYLHDKGWFKSFKTKKSVDLALKPIPWMTYSFIDFLSPRLKKEFDVFEYGCGNSSLWWIQLVNTVQSCEHNEGWFNMMSTNKMNSLSIILRPIDQEKYAKSISENTKKYDIVVIDGVDRVNCVKHSINQLKTNGVIIWDNSDRKEYQEGYDYLEKDGFKRLDFYGLGPINVMAWCTSVFYKNDNCLGI